MPCSVERQAALAKDDAVVRFTVLFHCLLALVSLGFVLYLHALLAHTLRPWLWSIADSTACKYKKHSAVCDYLCTASTMSTSVNNFSR